MLPAHPISKIWRFPRLHNLEILRGQHLMQSFPLHTHEQYAIGVIEHGALGYFYRGENIVAARGQINLCIPDEPHTGQPVSLEGWGYRMFYLEPSFIEGIVSDVAGCAKGLPFFQSGVISDDVIAQDFLHLHRLLENSDASLLESETLLQSVLMRFIGRYADATLRPKKWGFEPRAVILIKNFLEENFTEDVSLNALSHLTGLNRFHLVHVFTKVVGIAPHAFLRQVRVKNAKRLLLEGQGIAEVALACGFSDQSHLTRWFKRLWSVTPAQYRNSVQDAYSFSP
jgi:AraC-like DNA-binding protein